MVSTHVFESTFNHCALNEILVHTIEIIKKKEDGIVKFAHTHSHARARIGAFLLSRNRNQLKVDLIRTPLPI